MKKNVLAVVLLLILAAILAVHPSIEHAYKTIPEGINFGKNCGCDCILESRPWYGRINYWLWFWLISTPLMVFSLNPDSPRWQRSVRILFAIGLGHCAVNFGAHMAMDIRNAPFLGRDGMANCTDLADGAKFVAAFYFAWVYAAIYTGWWEIVWYLYHKNRIRLFDKKFSIDWFGIIVAFTSGVISVFVAAVALGYLLAKPS